MSGKRGKYCDECKFVNTHGYVRDCGHPDLELKKDREKFSEAWGDYPWRRYANICPYYEPNNL